jgi:hypothetical protein
VKLLSMLRRPDERERHAHQRYVQVLEKAVQVMPGDEKLREAAARGRSPDARRDAQAVNDPITLVLAVVIIVEALWSIRAAYRLSKLYQTRLFESEFFSRLVARNKRVAYVGGGAIAAVVIWGLLSWVFPEYVPVIPRPWSSVLVGIALMVMLAGPILDEHYVSGIRKGSREE